MNKENEKPLSAEEIVEKYFGGTGTLNNLLLKEIIKVLKEYTAQQCAEKDKEIERLADQMNVDTEKIIAFDETIRKYELLKQKADKLCYSAKGLRDYFMFFIKDPKFNEFINIVEAITNYEKQQ